MSYYNWRGFCLCGTEDIPPDAAAADAPFAPLVFLVRRDPLTARGLYAIERPEELSEELPDDCVGMPEQLASERTSISARNRNSTFFI